MPKSQENSIRSIQGESKLQEAIGCFNASDIRRREKLFKDHAEKSKEKLQFLLPSVENNYPKAKKKKLKTS